MNTLIPWDKELVFNSIKKTGKVLLLGEDTIFNSYIGEISAVISEEIFEYLDAPVIRVGSLDTPVPFAKNLEEGFQANYILKDKLDYLLNYYDNSIFNLDLTPSLKLISRNFSLIIAVLIDISLLKVVGSNSRC